MSPSDDRKPDELRLRAEAIDQHALNDESKDDRFLSPEESRKALHELRVHQIELEMQNDALREAQRALEESRDRFADLYEFAPVGYLTLSTNGLINGVNLTAVKLLGVERGMLLQRRFTPLVIAEDQDRWTQFFLGLKGLDKAGGVELRMRRGDGAAFAARLDCQRRRVRATGTAIRVVLSDVTDRKLQELALMQAKEAAESADRAKTTFLAKMSHELRTPLNAIMGMTKLAQRGASEPRQIDQLETVMQASHHLLRLITDILDISRIEAERLQLEMSEFTLGGVVATLVQANDGAAKKRNLRLVIDVAESLTALPLTGDPIRLGQILHNLIDNAIKFTDDGSITLRAHLIDETGTDVALRFEVQDTGIGVAAADLSRLFRQFEQADNSMTRRHGGTGLGLSIAKDLVELMGGKIGVESNAGAGSTFWFTLRLGKFVTLASPADRTGPSAEEQLRMGYHGARLLVVEDDPYNQLVICELAQHAGLAVDLAENGQVAVEKAGAADYDLILMDVQLPVMDGLTATMQIRQIPGRHNLPIVAITGNAFPGDRTRCLDAGMNAFLSKPVEIEALFETMLACLEKRRALPGTALLSSSGSCRGSR